MILEHLYNNNYELFVTNNILLEYEEKITEIFSRETSELILGALALLDNVRNIEPYFQLGLIPGDPDDNKFVNCAFAGNVHFIVTEDRHFRVLRSVAFPVINTVSLEEFKKSLEGSAHSTDD